MNSSFAKRKVILLFFLFGLFTVHAVSQQTLTKINGLNAYVHLPDDYYLTNQNYPVIIFFPGVGETGKDETKLLEVGPSKFIHEGHNMQFTVNGIQEKPIVISIQPIDPYPQPAFLDLIFNTVVANWRIDPNRFNLTGLSMGGFCADNYVTHSVAYASRVTSIVAMSAVIPNNPISNFEFYALGGGKWWGFEGTFDNRSMDKIRDVMNAAVPGSARYTSFIGGHSGWNKWYDPEYKEEGLNIYEWMLLQSKGARTLVNQLPIANAGPDQRITLPVDNCTLNGSASLDPDGTITGYLWEKVSGPSQFNLTSKNTEQTTVTNLTEGTYVFKLTVTDDMGASTRDQVSILVTASQPNQPPAANAGPDLSITLPSSQVTLNGNGSDPDGSISGFNWKQNSGPVEAVIANPHAANTQVNSLTVAGVYEFALSVTDNEGATTVSLAKVTVLGAAPPPNQPPPNQPPTVSAGPDQTITLLVSEVTLSGSATDPDGLISGFSWKQISGPSLSAIASPHAAVTLVNSLSQAGVYEFALTVTDNEGATAVSVAKVTVHAAIPPPNQAPSANAGPDLNITLPASEATLSGSATDPDGSISGFSWKQNSGPVKAVITSSNTAVTLVNALSQAGVYEFALTVTDNEGSTAVSVVKVTVHTAVPPPNQPPTANAGPDFSITLPASQVTLSGSGNDPDGSISGFSWKQISGPSQSVIVSPKTAVTLVKSLTVAGVYEFLLLVTDNEGATGTAIIKVVVNNGPFSNNQPPVAKAGPDITITLPKDTLMVFGEGKDTDGFINSYSWTRIKGSTQINIVDPHSPVTVINGVEKGIYEMVLTVTDNDGLTARDTLVITVNEMDSYATKYSVYPNPFSGIINVNFASQRKGKFKLTIYQTSGSIVYSADFVKEAETFTRRLNLANLLTGVYIAELRFQDGKTYVVQVMKQ
ncbi:MAG: PKD domain-containing protein [Chitinophagaceae bacterium]